MSQGNYHQTEGCPSRENLDVKQKQLWQTPELQEADYQITSNGTGQMGDGSGVGKS
jgi:hypothetical protein